MSTAAFDDMVMDEAVATAIINRGEPLAYLTPLKGRGFLCRIPFHGWDRMKRCWQPTSFVAQAGETVPSWAPVKSAGVHLGYFMHRLDILQLHALCVKKGYMLKASAAALEKLSQLSAEYRARLRWKSSDFDGYADIPAKRPLDRLQLIGANYLFRSRFGMNTDCPGSGKTAQAYGAVILNKLEGQPYRTLVVCPTSAKGVWLNELGILRDDIPGVLIDSMMSKRMEQWQMLAQNDVAICGFQTFTDDYKEIVQYFKPDILIIDEAHRLCEKGNKITQILIGGQDVKRTFLSMANPHSIYLLTGTPLINTQEDLYSLLKTMETSLWTWKGFRNRYVRIEEGVRWERFYNERTKKVEARKRKYLTTVGYKNEAELRTKLNLYSIHRTEDEILPDLADGGKNAKIFMPIPVIPFSPEERRIYDELRDEWHTEIRGKEVAIKNPLDWVVRAQQICNSLETYKDAHGLTTSSKMDWLKAFVAENAKDHKIVIFSKFEKMTSIITRELRGYNSLHLNGSVPDNKRFIMWHDKFQMDPRYRVFVSTYGAGSVAITLTAADICIMYDRPWTFKDFEQGFKRLHRRGQKGRVKIFQPSMEDSFDMHIDETWRDKGRTVADMVGVDVSINSMLSMTLKEMSAQSRESLI